MSTFDSKTGYCPVRGKIKQAAVLLCALLLIITAGCGGGGGGMVGLDREAALSVQPVAGPVPSAGELADRLASELARLGVDPLRAPGQAPSGEANRVFDLQAEVIPGEAAGTAVPNQLRLAWTEVLVGDYNQDGVVNASDLTPIGQYYAATVAYDDPGLHDGFAYWPVGDPTGDGARNWRLARVDGNRNGLIDIADITTIAQHWQEASSGYRIYRQRPQDDGFLAVPPAGEGEGALLLDRGDFAPAAPDQPVRFQWSSELPVAGEYSYFVTTWNDAKQAQGTTCEPLTIFSNVPPVARFAYATDTLAGNYTVDFDAGASWDIDGTVTGYAWDLDNDGEFETDGGNDPVLRHSFPAPGSYHVALRVTDDCGGTGAGRTALFLGYETHAGFTVAEPYGKYPHTTTFDPAASWASRGIALYEWDFDGDGTVDAASGDPLVQEFTYLDHGEFSAVLTVTDTGGVKASAQQPVTVIDNFHVILTPFLEKGLVPFTAGCYATHYLARWPVTYDWDLDDDGEYELTGLADNYITTVFDDAGYHTIRVRATDGNGRRVTDSVQVKGCLAPLPDLGSNLDYYRGPANLTFTTYGSQDPDGRITAYEWQLDGLGGWVASGFDDLGEPVHPALACGLGGHTVQLRVTDDDGFSTTTTHDFTVIIDSQIMVFAAPSSGSAPLTVDFTIEVNAPPELTLERVWLLPGDGSVKELGTSGYVHKQHTYQAGSYTARVLAMDSDYTLVTREVGIEVSGTPRPTATLVIRNDDGVFPANYDALLSDLAGLGLDYQEVDYYPGIATGYLRDLYNPVVWYRGGPGDDGEPQVHDTAWTTAEIDDYLGLTKRGGRLLLVSQSHGINDEAYGYPATGWTGWYGWDVLPGTIPDSDPRHPWAAGTSLASGYTVTGTAGYLRISPRNILPGDAPGGRFTGASGYESPAAERWSGGSGFTPVALEFPAGRQFCGIGFDPGAGAGDRCAASFTEGVGLDPLFEDQARLGFVSWGTTFAPYEDVGLWPPPFSFQPGPGRLWVVGYSWGETVVSQSEPPGMTRAQLLANIIGWLME